MKKTLLALTSALLLAGASAANAQSYYYDWGYGSNPAYYNYDSDHDGIADRYDRYDNRYDRYDDRYDRYDHRYAYDSRDTDGYYGDRYGSYGDRRTVTYGNDRNCYDRNGYYSNRDCYDRRDDRSYRAQTRYYAPTRYVAPYGYRYQTYDVGSYLPMGYYGSSYYIDYRPYGLTPPPYGYRWVRVGGDVYLVQTRTGLIMESVMSLFR